MEESAAVNSETAAFSYLVKTASWGWYEGDVEMIKAKPTILVIDDDLQLQMMLDMALQNAGYHVVSAHNGQEGLEKIVSLRPDVVVTDIMMPMMDGVEMFRQIKDRMQDSGTPIIVMTALQRKPWFEELEMEGAVILQKPFKIDLMLDLIKMNLS